MDAHVSKMTENGTNPLRLRLGHITLVLEQDTLAVQDSHAKKASRTCGGLGLGSASASHVSSIPYTHILWAEVVDGSVLVNYAKTAGKQRVEARSTRWQVPANDDSHELSVSQFISQLLDRAYPAPIMRRKRAWVVVNPKAGPGGADKIWEKDVRPIFEGARMPITAVHSTAAREAITLAENLDIEQFDIAVPCSGDGGPHEIFNGLGRRPDARRALSKLAVCLVPCGSGNALGCNQYGTTSPTLAALAIVKGIPTAMDLASVTQGGNRTLSFLSQAYGIMADLDIKTEHLRWMGATRFTVGFLQLVFKKKMYPCDIACKVEVEGKDAIRAHYRRYRQGAVADGKSDASTLADGPGLPPLRYGTAEDKLPEGWELIPHEKLGYFYCGNMGYVAPDTNFFPAALPNDGTMDLFTMDGDHSPWTMIALQDKVGANDYIDSPLVNYRKISALRLVPRTADPEGVISIDGESFPYTPFQVEVHPGLGLTLTRAGVFEAPGPKGWETAA